MNKQWQQLIQARETIETGGGRPLPAPSWARHSLFHHHGQPLQVLEAFAPWVATRSCRHG